MEASSPRKPGDVTQLINKNVRLSSAGCLTFWYHMYGRAIGTLSIYDVSTNTPKLLWAQYGDKQDVWLNARVGIMYILQNILYLNQPFRFCIL